MRGTGDVVGLGKDSFAGWEHGTYVLKLHLDVDGALYASTWDETVEVSENMVFVDGDTGGGSGISMIMGLMAAAIVVIVAIGIYFIIRRRQGIEVADDVGTLSDKRRL